MRTLLNTLKSRMSWLLSLFTFDKRVQSGSISYDYWNEIHRNFRRKLVIDKYKVEKEGFDSFGEIDPFIAKISEDTRQNKHPNITIYFKEKKARLIYDGKMPTDYFSWYDIRELTTHTYRLQDGKPKESEISMNFRVNPSWNVVYTVDKVANDFKEILGFKCTKYKVTQRKEIDGAASETIYELYGTDEIKLPAHLICGWFDYILEVCPLEIKMYRPKSPEIISYFKVRDISNQLPKSIFEIPSKFKN